MKMNLKKMVDEADNGILDEIIGRSEKKMVEPFKKKETVIAIAKPEEEMEEGMEKPEMEMEGESAEASIPPEDMEMLMELYAKIKGSKEV
jgi:hypothetical protein